ncbi:MAG: hypothetical protein GDA50_06870 [Alphaproteobacteria bacterium GM202ARS2]|nr:hypothetical protein [Alphaproteobacteria bacterium GM202ARS2]
MHLMEYRFDDCDFIQVRDYVRRVLSLPVGDLAGNDDEADFSPSSCLEERLAARNVFQALLLRETLRYAQSMVPGHKARLSTEDISWRTIGQLEDIRHIPVSDRTFLLENYHNLIAPNVPIDSFRSTSGTSLSTKGKSENQSRRLIIPANSEESEFCNLIHRRANSDLSSNEQKSITLDLRYPARRIVGHLNGHDNGNEIIIPVPLILHYSTYSGGYDSFDHLFKILFEEFDIPGIASRASSIIALPAFMLRIIAQEAETRGIDLRKTEIAQISAAGYLMSEIEQVWVEKTWGARVHTSLSCAESNGMAFRCPKDRKLYHSSVAQIVEVLHPETHLPVAVGEDGLFCVTTLLPFQSVMPFIRYFNGDIVRRGPDVCSCGYVGQSVAFVGRIGRSVDLSNWLEPTAQRRFLGEGDCYEILDRCLGLPRGIQRKFRLDLDAHPREAAVTAVVEVNCGMPEPQAAELRTDFAEGCANLDLNWLAAVRERRISFNLNMRLPGDREDYYVIGT